MIRQKYKARKQKWQNTFDDTIVSTRSKMFRLVTFHVLLCTITIYGLTSNLMDLLYLDRIECEFNKEICGKTVCSSRFFNRTTKLGTINCFSMVPFESIKVKSTMFYRFTGGFRQFAINIANDYCAVMNGTEKSVLLDVFLNYIKGYSNIDRKCPFTGNNSVIDLPLTAQLIGGQFLPAGDYIYQSVIHINGVHGLTWKAHFNIPAGKTILDDRMGK